MHAYEYERKKVLNMGSVCNLWGVESLSEFLCCVKSKQKSLRFKRSHWLRKEKGPKRAWGWTKFCVGLGAGGLEWKKKKLGAAALCGSNINRWGKRGLLQPFLCVVNVTTFHILRIPQARLEPGWLGKLSFDGIWGTGGGGERSRVWREMEGRGLER